MKGYIHVYTGNGKGKTTAALGMALRAAGAGKKVFIGQFVKGMEYSEVKAIKKYKLPVNIHQYGLDCFIKNKPTQADIDSARKGLAEVSTILSSGNFDMIILDEATIALYYNLFTTGDLIKALDHRTESCEIIITGRYAPEKLIAMADLVTEMKEIKHYYKNGVEARKGIEC